MRSLTSPSPRPYIGGQAVLEGVMMRAPRSFAVVVRRRDGSLYIREREMRDGARGIARWPLVRGVASLADSLRIGSEALRFSADQAEKDLAFPLSGRAIGVIGAVGLALFAMATRDDDAGAQSSRSGSRPSAAGLGMIALAVVFFVALPQVAAAAINRALGLGLPVQSAAFQAMTGALKLMIVIGYLLGIRRVPEIRRVFQYHGAEHKTISTYEAGEALTVDNARKKTTLHPRCGTTFLVMVALVSILVFTAVGAVLPRIGTGSTILDNLLFFGQKLPFLPLIVAFTFELQRFFARYCAAGPLRALLWPGFLVQKITTAEPDDRQLEVALASLRVTLFRQDGALSSQGLDGDPDEDVAFPSYEALLSADRLRPAA